MRNRQNSGSPTGSPSQPNQTQDSVGPQTINTEIMSDTYINRELEDARKANKVLHMKDTNGKVNKHSTKFPKREEDDMVENNSETDSSELELPSNFCSSTEFEQSMKEANLRRSKLLTKTNLIVRL